MNNELTLPFKTEVHLSIIQKSQMNSLMFQGLNVPQVPTVNNATGLQSKLFWLLAARLQGERCIQSNFNYVPDVKNNE